MIEGGLGIQKINTTLKEENVKFTNEAPGLQSPPAVAVNAAPCSSQFLHPRGAFSASQFPHAYTGHCWALHLAHLAIPCLSWAQNKSPRARAAVLCFCETWHSTWVLVTQKITWVAPEF